jgi:probable selenium-dependent hydroxylase accessory protein YqeC
VERLMPLLSELIQLPARPLIALVGAGGKTTTMYTLADELAQRPARVITTTTTNIYVPRAGETDTLIVASDAPTLIKMVQAAWKEHRRITVASKVVGAGKIGGLEPAQAYELLSRAGAQAVIVEADGARHAMVKAPTAHEPVVPAQTNVALLLMSAAAVGQPLGAAVAHRPERVAAVLGIEQGDILSPALLARLMMGEEGAMKNIPATAQVYLLLTHARPEKRAALQELAAEAARSPRLAHVFCSAQPGTWRDVADI